MLTTASGIELPKQYAHWNAALKDHYFTPEHRYRPVYFQVETDALEALSGEVGISREHAVYDLVSSVRLVYSWEHGPRPALSETVQAWLSSPRRVEIAPPFLAVLGLCVLAASKMERDTARDLASNNYYARLNDLIGRSHSGRPPKFEEVTRYWRLLRQWLDTDNGGTLGRSTAAPLKYAHVGYPISQCLLRARDRAQLPDFFRSSDSRG
jgi:hypothetical protein